MTDTDLFNDAGMQLDLFSSNELSLAGAHSSKRGRDERAGVHTWHPYYAGYSERFVADVLHALARPGSLILDPWNGSGTTTLVAQRLGLNSIGIEINPVMVLHAGAKDLGFIHSGNDMAFQAERIVEAAQRGELASLPDGNPILEFVDIQALQALLSIKRAILEEPSVAQPPVFLHGLVRDDMIGTLDNRRAFFLSALFQVLRRVGNFKPGSNPTWLAVSKPAAAPTARSVFDLFLKISRKMLSDLRAASKGSRSPAAFAICQGDSRSLPLLDATVDLIVTSPPYCTRIDYAFSTKPELLLLDHNVEAFDKLRRSTMGAPVIAGKDLSRQEDWGTTCNNFLQAVAQHPSKASRSYYLPIYLQYFNDAEASLREIRRVLKDAGMAAVVVQSSYFKDVELALGEIYVEMARCIGLEASIARRENVRQHMAHVNTKSQKYVRDKVYFEDVMLLRKSAQVTHQQSEKEVANGG